MFDAVSVLLTVFRVPSWRSDNLVVKRHGRSDGRMEAAGAEWRPG